MKVKDVMMRTAASCSADTNLGAAVEILWSRNCGILPIVNADQRVIGVVTDRDICVALGTRNQLPGEVAVSQVTSGKVFCCKPDDDVHEALATMAQEKVRRLPVINSKGLLEGILSMDDVVAHSEMKGAGRPAELSHDDVMNALKRIYGSELPERVLQKTAIGA